MDLNKMLEYQIIDGFRFLELNGLNVKFCDEIFLNSFSIFLRRTKQFHVGFHRFEYLRGFECFVLLLLMLKDRRIFGGYQSDQP